MLAAPVPEAPAAPPTVATSFSAQGESLHYKRRGGRSLRETGRGALDVLLLFVGGGGAFFSPVVACSSYLPAKWIGLVKPLLVEARSLPLPTLAWPLHHPECPDGLDVGVPEGGPAPGPLDAVAARVAALEALEPVLSVMLANVTHGS